MLLRTLRPHRRLLSAALPLAVATGPNACAGHRGTGAPPVAGIVLPTRYDEHRFYVTPVTAAGDTLAFVLDSGINGNLASTDLAARLRLPSKPLVQGADTAWLAALPAFAPWATIPAPDTAGPLRGRFLTVPLAGEGLLIARAGDAGGIGSPWLAGRVWTFDYPRHRLLLHRYSASSPVSASIVGDHWSKPLRTSGYHPSRPYGPEKVTSLPTRSGWRSARTMAVVPPIE